MTIQKPIWLMTLVAAALAFAPGTAKATFSLTLGKPSSSVAPYPAPYGTVDVVLIDSTHATVIFKAGSTGGFNYAFGGAGTVGVNTHGDATITAATGSPHPGGSGPALSDAGAGSEDGFGKFSDRLTEFDGAGYSLTSVTFNLTKSTGTWASDSDVLAANSSGYKAAAHLFVFSGNSWSSALATGFVGNGTINAVPEPASIVMALTGVAGLGLARFRRGRVRPA